MSGSYNRKLYDNCQFNLQLKESVSPGEYRLFSGAHENELNNEFCSKNTNATISNLWSSIGDRTDVESDLNVIKRGTNCVDDKHKPCDNSKEKRCNPGVPANPRICERDIVPTNMKMPKKCGF
jgi:hypothetical protein